MPKKIYRPANHKSSPSIRKQVQKKQKITKTNNGGLEATKMIYGKRDTRKK